ADLLEELLPRVGGVLEILRGDLDRLVVIVLVRQDAELEAADALDQLLDLLDPFAGQGAVLVGGPVVAAELIDVAGGDLRVDLIDALGQLGGVAATDAAQFAFGLGPLLLDLADQFVPLLLLKLGSMASAGRQDDLDPGVAEGADGDVVEVG